VAVLRRSRHGAAAADRGPAQGRRRARRPGARDEAPPRAGRNAQDRRARVHRTGADRLRARCDRPRARHRASGADIALGPRRLGARGVREPPRPARAPEAARRDERGGAGEDAQDALRSNPQGIGGARGNVHGRAAPPSRGIRPRIALHRARRARLADPGRHRCRADGAGLARLPPRRDRGAEVPRGPSARGRGPLCRRDHAPGACREPSRGAPRNGGSCRRSAIARGRAPRGSRRRLAAPRHPARDPAGDRDRAPVLHRASLLAAPRAAAPRASPRRRAAPAGPARPGARPARARHRRLRGRVDPVGIGQDRRRVHGGDDRRDGRARGGRMGDDADRLASLARSRARRRAPRARRGGAW